ncbi:Uncharacterised protein [Yersinia pseudotuberculosis]|nr:Uncharacterised protein [Yersinia pseudotuberculosis]
MEYCLLRCLLDIDPKGALDIPLFLDQLRRKGLLQPSKLTATLLHIMLIILII